jgi:hypothetical protein
MDANNFRADAEKSRVEPKKRRVSRDPTVITVTLKLGSPLLHKLETIAEATQKRGSMSRLVDNWLLQDWYGNYWRDGRDWHRFDAERNALMRDKQEITLLLSREIVGHIKARADARGRPKTREIVDCIFRQYFIFQEIRPPTIYSAPPPPVIVGDPYARQKAARALIRRAAASYRRKLEG